MRFCLQHLVLSCPVRSCLVCAVMSFVPFTCVIPVEVRAGLASRQQVGLLVLKLHQLHEKVRLRQAEQGVNHGKVRLIKVIPHLQRSMLIIGFNGTTVTVKDGLSSYWCPLSKSPALHALHAMRLC